MPNPEGALWLFAGCNGAGKSTLLELAARPGGPVCGFPVLNPDHLTKDLLKEAGYDNYSRVPDSVYKSCFIQAAQAMERVAVERLRARKVVCIETVLSTRKYLRLVDEADRAGVPFNLIYVVLRSPELAVERVAHRVKIGGHPVPTEKIIERYTRSLDNLPVFAARASYFCVYDNSDATHGEFPLPIAAGENGELLGIKRGRVPQVDERLGADWKIGGSA